MGQSRNWRRVGGAFGLLLGAAVLAACGAGPSGAQRASTDGTSAENAPLGGPEDFRVPDGPMAGGFARPRSRDTSGMSFGGEEPARARPADAPPYTGPAADGVRITWEALAVEQELAENPRFGRRPQRGALTMQKIVLVNQSHPDAKANQIGRAARENAGVAVAAISDREMDAFVKGIQQRGFFQVARPTGSLESLFSSENARGRITLEKDGQSWSLVSMRGQGLDPASRGVPAMYSEMKQALIVLRNQTPTLSVVGMERDPLR